VITTFVRSRIPATPPPPAWMAPDYKPRHAAPDPLPISVDPALRLPADLLELWSMFQASHRALLGGGR
jgi:hypothetical protein